MFKKIILCLWMGAWLAAPAFTEPETAPVCLAINFTDNNLTEAQIRTELDSYGLKVENVSEQDSVGFRVIEARTDSDIITICRKLKSDTVADIAHRIFEFSESIVSLGKRNPVESFNAGLSLFFYRNLSKSGLFEKLNLSNDFREIIAIFDVFNNILNTDDSQNLIDYYNTHSNINVLQLLSLNALSSLKQDTFLFGILRDSIINDTDSILKSFAISGLGAMNNSEANQIINNVLNSQSETEENKICAALALAKKSDDSGLPLARSIISEYQSKDIIIIENAIKTIGLLGDSDDSANIQSIRGIADPPVIRAIELAEEQIYYRTLDEMQKTVFLVNKFNTANPKSNEILDWIVDLMLRSQNSELVGIIKKSLIENPCWNSNIQESGNEQYFMDSYFMQYYLLQTAYKNNLRL